MDQNPLVDQMIDAGQRFVEKFDKTFPITVAFWLKDRDENSWNLHFASPKIGDADRQQAFAEIVRVTREMNNPYLDSLDIRMRRMNDRIVQFALDFRRRHPAFLATVFNVPTLEGVEVDGMYLYPPLKAAAV